MNEKMARALSGMDLPKIYLRDWGEGVRRRHSELCVKTASVLEMEGPLQKAAARVCLEECAALRREFAEWRRCAEKEGALKEAQGWMASLGAGLFSGAGALTAGGLKAVAGLIKEVGLPAVIAVPAILGAGVAYAKNRITSPSDENMRNEQSQIYLNTLRTKVAEIKRQREEMLAKRRAAEEGLEPRSRSIRAV